MPTEHRDVDAQLRAFAVALEVHTSEPIRPGARPVADVDRDPVLVETVAMPPSPDRRRWVLPAVAAAVLAVVLAGVVALRDETTPSDTPPSTTTPPTTTMPEDDTQQPSPADVAVIDAFFAAYNEGDTDAVLALLADDVVVTEVYGGAPPNPSDDPFPNPDQRLAWKHAQGEIITTPDCVLAAEQPAEGTTSSCEYATSDAFVQAVDGTPIPTRALFTVVGGEITELHQGYGNPDYSILASQFRRWIEQNHPDMFDALFADWTTRDEATSQGRLRAEWAQEWARSLLDSADEQATVTPRPVTFAPALAAPVDGETQESIVGEITWTRVDGATSTVPSDVVVEFDGVFYGRQLPVVLGDELPWFTSQDGVAWVPWNDGPAEMDLTVAADRLWAVSGEPGSPFTGSALRLWDGTGFSTIDLPALGVPPGGLTVRSYGVAVVAELGDQVAIVRSESFSVPWDELLGIEPPLTAFEEGGGWSGTFRVRAFECTDDWGFGRSCGGAADAPTWTIRPEIVEGTPTRIDLYDDDTGELVTTVVPPEDGRAIDDVLFSIGAENHAGVRIEHFVADADGTNIREVDWPFDFARLAELDGRLFAVSRNGTSPTERLWRTGDLELWEELPLPAGIHPGGWSDLGSDGSTMILSIDSLTSSPMWISTDGTTWTAWESPLPGNSTRRVESAEFGWLTAHDFNPDPERTVEEPSIAISPDGETWQLMPIPVSSVLVDRGMSWSDVFEAEAEGVFDFDVHYWEVSTLGNTIFLVFRSYVGELAPELWVGRVDTS